MKLSGAGFALLLLAPIAAFADGPRDTPDTSMTPGMVASMDEADVCSTEGGTYSQRHRLTQNAKTKHEVFAPYVAKYGAEVYANVSAFEDDHDVALSLGGSDDVHNRWPEPRTGTVWDASKKDKLEAEAWRRVCHEHTLSLHDAQALFLAPADWRVSYCKLFPTDSDCSAP